MAITPESAHSARGSDQHGTARGEAKGEVLEGGGGLGGGGLGDGGLGGGGTLGGVVQRRRGEGEEGAMAATRARLEIGCGGALTADPILTQRESGATLESARLCTESAARREEGR